MKKLYSIKGGLLSRIFLGLVVFSGSHSAICQTEASDSKIKTSIQTEFKTDSANSVVKTQKINTLTINKPIVRDNYVQIAARRDGEKKTCKLEFIESEIIEIKEGGSDEN